jgi:two-component system OmpR family response regulator
MKTQRILIVDDEQGFACLLGMAFEATGRYMVRIETNADAALSATLEFNPDLVLLDVVLPRLLGSDLARRFLATARLRQIPIIFTTAPLGPNRASNHLGNLCGFPVIAKPMDPNVLVTVIDHMLSRCNPQAAGTVRKAPRLDSLDTAMPVAMPANMPHPQPLIETSSQL